MKIFLPVAGVIVALFVMVFTVAYYWDSVAGQLFPENSIETIYVGQAVFSVTIADDAAERTQGLSGVRTLPDFEGKLFIFDTEKRHGMWMKDMHFPIDILWFDNNFELVHSASQVTPDTYPAVFTPDKPARFVLEINADLVRSLGIAIGDRVTIPPAHIPKDIKKILQ